MPRSTENQARTFVWSGQDLVSVTNPENGTVTYVYDGAHRVTSRTDAKSQQTQYTYDTYGRLTEVRHYPSSGNEDTSQRWDYYYDSNPFDGSYSSNTWGRLAAVQFGSSLASSMQEMYSYNVAGRVTGQRLYQTPGSLIDMRVSYAWDNEGKMTSQSYPVPPNSLTGDGSSTLGLTYQYDSMARLTTMGFGDQTTTATYGPAGELTSLNTVGTTWGYVWETRTYNSMLQLTQIQSTSNPNNWSQNIQYVYSATQNNGRITQSNRRDVG